MALCIYTCHIDEFSFVTVIKSVPFINEQRGQIQKFTENYVVQKINEQNSIVEAVANKKIGFVQVLSKMFII